MKEPLTVIENDVENCLCPHCTVGIMTYNASEVISASKHDRAVNLNTMSATGMTHYLHMCDVCTELAYYTMKFPYSHKLKRSLLIKKSNFYLPE